MRFLTSIALLLALSTSTAAQEIADLVIWGGPIYTADDNQPTVEAVAIKDGRFVYVGSKLGAEALVADPTTVISLDGAALFPGFVDGHAHLSGIGARELTLNLEGITSLKEIIDAVKAWREGHPEDAIITGRGWIETHWPEKRFPSRWDLDQIVSDIPVLLSRADGHALVANTKALEMAGISSETQAPFGGDILKNALGEPTGMLIDAGMNLVSSLIPGSTPDSTALELATGGKVYATYGWTGTHNMSVPWSELDIMEQLSDTGDLGIRVYNSIDMGDSQILFAQGPRANGNGRIVTRAIKMYMDGALGSRGAALLEKYSDADTYGLVMMKPEEALPIMEEALRAGLQVNTHAIGDRGNRMVLDWYQDTFSRVPLAERAIEVPLWRIEHSQIINPDDIPRFNSLGVIPSMQPSHAIGDLHFAPERLGDDRLKGAYAWQSLISSGVIVVGGSDAPVERGDPLIEFYGAVARADLKGFQGENWHSEEAVSREDALKMFTLWPAEASFAADRLGSITVGKLADLTAFDVDIMNIPAAEIPNGKAIMTIVEGEIIYIQE